jgi:TolB-like protein
LHEGHAVVADFGIGKALVAASAATGVMFTQIGVTVGTPAYMSPEQAAGGDLDGRRDLFALGCVMYEMLTGDIAFTGPSAHAVMSRRFAYSPPPVTDSHPDIPVGVAETVSRLLQRSADDRFASGADVVAALRAQQTPSVATAAVAPDRARRDTSIAVLPFINLSADPDNEYFSDGLTEELITDLSGVKSLRVISRTSSLQLKGTTKGMREIGRTLGVRYALTGSARKAGNTLRITAQLVDTTADEQIWAEKYSGTMDDVFDVQERVSRAIVAALRVTLTVRGRAARRAPDKESPCVRAVLESPGARAPIWRALFFRVSRSRQPDRARRRLRPEGAFSSWTRWRQWRGFSSIPRTGLWDGRTRAGCA